jgi:hypothetical protein
MFLGCTVVSTVTILVRSAPLSYAIRQGFGQQKIELVASRFLQWLRWERSFRRKIASHVLALSVIQPTSQF